MSVSKKNRVSKITPQRRSLLARVHIAKKELRLDDDTYRDCVELIASGKRSASDLSNPQLNKLLQHFVSKGWSARVKKPKAVGSSFRTTSKRPMIRKIYVLWKILYEAGKVHQKRPDGFVKRQTKTLDRPDGLANVEWLDDGEAYSVIEALKKWIRREGLEGALRD